MPIEDLTWEDWNKAFISESVRIRTKKKNKNGKIETPRRFVRINKNGKKISLTFARVVWNCMHPEDILTKEYDIHHKDEDSLNDCPENLEKVHYSLHRGPHKKWNDELIGKMIRGGFNYRAMAQVLGVSKSSLYNHIVQGYWKKKF